MDKALLDQPMTKMTHVQKVLREVRLMKDDDLLTTYEQQLGEKPLTRQRRLLETAVVYVLMAKSAAHLWHGGKEPIKIKAEREKAIALCRASDALDKKETKVATKVEQKKEVIVEAKPMEVVKKEPPKKSPDDLAKKLKAMSLDALIKWAKELGVEKVEEIAKRHPGLAKMQLGNGVRSALKKKEKK